MSNKYYQQELSHLRDTAQEFARAYPALAPMLGGTSQDPDVERLLEGTAFLTGLMREKLEDEFPELIHGLMRMTFPHYLRPLPSATIMAFTPKPNLMETMLVPKGTALASTPVDGVKCLFRTSQDLKVYPVSLNRVQLRQPSGAPATLVLGFTSPLSLDSLELDSLRLHFTGSYSEAANIHSVILRHTLSVEISSRSGGTPLQLRPGCIKPCGFEEDSGLIPYPGQAFPGYRILQEYFILPEKFLFAEITGLDAWTDRGTGNDFEIAIQLDRAGIEPLEPFRISKDNIALFAVPAVNLFPHEAQPIILDHTKTEYRIMPAEGVTNTHQIFSVDKVTGITRGSVEKREFLPFEHFKTAGRSTPAYNLNLRQPLTRPFPEMTLAVAYPPDEKPPQEEILSLDISCTNGLLPESLRLGDISQPTDTSPLLMDFKNIRQPTPPVQPPLGGNLLWRFLSHLTVNLLSLADGPNLKELLRLYVFPDGRDRAAILANLKRIDGIMDLEATESDILYRGSMIRGHELEITIHPDHFPCTGDQYLFGSILDHFFAGYCSINSYTRLTFRDALKKDRISWPPRMGDRPLL